MADINTYTCTPCGPTPGGTYEIPVLEALIVPEGNLAAVKISVNPNKYVCCSIDRSQANQTPEEDVKTAQDSTFTTSECQQCNDHWKSVP